MRVLHLLGERVDLGGILTVIRNLQQASLPWGFEHIVWVNRDFVETRRPPLSYRYSRHMCADSPNHLAIVIRAFRGFLELRRLLREETFDVLHAHSRCSLLVGLGVAARLKRPVLFTNHSYARRIRLYQRAARTANFYTVVLTPNMARHYGLMVQPNKINVVSACCADRFFAEPLVSENSCEPNRRRVRLVGVGNIVRWKKWHLLIEALLQLTTAERARVHFSHWGSTLPDTDSQSYRHELLQCLRQHRLEADARLHGETTAVADGLRDGDWFVLPSTNEPCSVALIEAMALGLPALVSASGGNMDIVRQGKTGLLFKPEDPVDLATQLRLILHSTCEPASSAEIRESVRSRSATEVARQYAALYQQLAGRDKTPLAARRSEPLP